MRWLLAAALAGSALAVTSSANAATFVPGSPQFIVVGDPFSGPVSAQIGNSGTSAPDTVLQDMFQFTLGQTGVGGGSLTSIAATLGTSNDTDLLSVLVNGMSANLVADSDPLTETFSLSGVPITAGVLNTITVNYLSRGQFSYGGNIAFTPTAAVPEPASWALMLIGLGSIAAVLRRKKRNPHAAGAYARLTPRLT